MSVSAAIRAAGGQARLARAVGATQQRVAEWAKQDYVPLKYLEAVTLRYNIPAVTLLHPLIRKLLK